MSVQAGDLGGGIEVQLFAQVRHRHSAGRSNYDRMVAEGRTHREALRALKRRISDALYAAMVADARRDEQVSGGPGGQTGNGSIACAAGSDPAEPALRPSHSRAATKPRPSRQGVPSRNLRENQKKIRKAS
jgi:transposase